ncbi:MAG: molybdate ABC transporter permease subunit [Rhodobacterales bacterium]|jgi:molybdate transport system permease protein|uniref:molybdate ABC transporter permease subunit n=1 Tax=uncultured Planktomarina sp. TaxID=1538529 RepID=UPI003260FA93|tara:strand:- start:12580 stop:13266 length:687 start_codon:yes stop_codon:yes gene_type:complete
MSWLSLSPVEFQALTLSLWVAMVSVLVSLPFATAVAYILARRRFWGHGLLNALVHLPLVLPPVVTGYLLLMAFGRRGIFGPPLEALGLQLAFTSAGAALAAAVMAFPLIVRAIRLALEAVDPKLEEAASTLGASSVKVFIFVTLPLSLPGILAGAVVGFAKALGEFGATITFVSNIPGETQTIASAIYALLQVPGQEAAVGRMIGFSILLSFGALLLSEVLARRMVRR